MGAGSSLEQQIRKDADDAVLLTYPPVLAAPSSPSLRYQTPSRTLPSTFSDTATADDMLATVGEAALVGATSIVVLTVFDPAFDVTTTRAAVAQSLVDDLGISAPTAATRAATLVVAARTVAEFTTALYAMRTTLSADAGHAVTDGELDAVVLAFEIAVETATPTWIRGRLYLVTDSLTGERFTVESATDATSLTLALKSPLPAALAAGSDVVGFAILSNALPSSSTETIGRGVAEWKATLDGVVHVWAQDLRVAGRSVAYQLTAATVARLSPFVVSARPPDDVVFDEIIEFAWSFGVVPQMVAKGLRPERIVSWETINPWHLAEIEKRLSEIYETDLEKHAVRETKAITAASLALGSSSFWYDAGDDLAPPADVPSPSWNTSRVTR